jgi:hypothetical protein
MKHTDARRRVELEEGDLMQLLDQGVVADDQIEIVVTDRALLPVLARISE